MSMLPGRERALHKRERWDSDFYVEPGWVSEALFKAVIFKGPIHDPAAGTARSCGSLGNSATKPPAPI